MNNVLSKVIVARFYKINSGFFLVLFVLLFGLLNGKATLQLHYGVMQSITTSFAYLAAAMALWVLYWAKCISFSIKEINSPANNFLFAMQSVSNERQFLSWLWCHAVLLLPVLAYATLTVLVGIAHGHYLLSILFAVFQLLLCLAGAATSFRLINRTWKEPLMKMPALFANNKKSLPFYLLHYSMHARKRTFVGIKLLSLLILQVMITVNAYEINKESICVFIMFLVSAHALLPVYYVGFMEGDMAFLRNLPLPAMRRFLVYVFTYAIIFLPELLFLLINGYNVLPLQLIGSLYALAISQMALYTSLQYVSGMNTDKFTIIVFVLFFGFLLFLASFNLWMLFIVEAGISTLMFSILKNRYSNSIT